MDQMKIGKFIAECRKQKKLTKIQLATKLNITDKAISVSASITEAKLFY